MKGLWHLREIARDYLHFEHPDTRLSMRIHTVSN